MLVKGGPDWDMHITIYASSRDFAHVACSNNARRSPLQWRHNEGDDVSNHQPHDCLLNLLFRRRSKKTSKLRVTGLWEGNSPVTGEFPAQRASNADNVSIWWRHHEIRYWPLPCSTLKNPSHGHWFYHDTVGWRNHFTIETYVATVNKNPITTDQYKWDI